MIGFIKNGIELPGTIADGGLQATLACILFVAVIRLMKRRRQREA